MDYNKIFDELPNPGVIWMFNGFKIIKDNRLVFEIRKTKEFKQEEYETFEKSFKK